MRARDAASSPLPPLVSTETRSMRNSAGLQLAGMGYPCRANHALASSMGPEYTTRPPAMRQTSSNSATMDPRGWWMLHTTVRRSSFARLRSDSTTFCAWNASKPDVGSSAQITAGDCPTSSHASARRFFSPPLIPRVFLSPTRVSRTWLSPRRFRTASTAALISGLVAPRRMRILAAVVTVSSTVSCE